MFQPQPTEHKAEEIEDEDFFAKQQRLQAEATMALAQVSPNNVDRGCDFLLFSVFLI